MRKKLLPLLLLLLLPLLALASVDGMPYAPELSLCWQQLTAGQQDLFSRLYPRLMAGETDIEFDSPVDYDDVTAVMNVLHVDFPELCGMGNSWSTTYYTNRPQEATGVTVTMELPASSRQQMLEQAAVLLSGLSDDTLSR